MKTLKNECSKHSLESEVAINTKYPLTNITINHHIIIFYVLTTILSKSYDIKCLLKRKTAKLNSNL